MTTIFLSYSDQDEIFAKDLQSKLHGKRYDVWWLDQPLVKGSENWETKSREGIDNCNVFIVVLSESVRQCEYVQREVAYALEQQKDILPIKALSFDQELLESLDIVNIDFLDFSKANFTKHLMRKLSKRLVMDMGWDSTSRRLTVIEKELFVEAIYKWLDTLDRTKFLQRTRDYLYSYYMQNTDLSNLLSINRFFIPIAWGIAINYAFHELNPEFTKQDAVNLGKLAYLPEWAIKKIKQLFKAKVNWDQIRMPSSLFEGRHDELDEIVDLLKDGGDNTSVLLIDGFPGIGKTTLAINAISRLDRHFDFIFWVDLYQITSLERVLKNILRFLDDTHDSYIDENIDELLDSLMNLLQLKTCLLVIDNFEILLNANGTYREGYEKYDRFLQRLCYLKSPSSVMITSRRQPVNFATWRSSLSKYVHYLIIQPLTWESVQTLCEQLNFSTSIQNFQRLTKHISGNPFVLMSVLQIIGDDYNHSIEEYLEYKADSSSVPLQMREWIESTVNELSSLHREVLYRLMIKGEWTSKELLLGMELYSSNVSTPMLHQTLLILKQRKLIEKNHDEEYRLIYLVYEYLIEDFVYKLTQEIVSGDIDLLHKYPIMEAQASDHIRERQERFIIGRINVKLMQRFKSKESVSSHFASLINNLRTNHILLTSYMVGSTINLLHQLGIPLIGWDFSKFTIRQAQLRDCALHNVNFSECVFYDCSFAQPFYSILSFDISHNGKLLVAGMTQGCIIWEIDTFRQLWTREDTFLGWINQINFTQNDEYVIAVNMSSYVWILDTYTGQIINNFRVSEHRHWSSLYIPEQNAVVIGGVDPEIKIVDIGNTHLLRAFNHQNLSSSSEGKVYSLGYGKGFLFAGSSLGDIYCWDILANQHYFTIERAHQYPIWSIAISEDGHYLASGDEGNRANDISATIHIWDLQNSNTLIATFSEHTDTVFDLKFSEDSTLLFSGSADHDVRIWSPQLSICNHILRGHTRWIRQIQQNPFKSRFLYSGGEDRRIQIWDIEEGKPIYSIVGQSSRIRNISTVVGSSIHNISSLYSGLLVIATEDPHLYLWNIDTEISTKIDVVLNAWSRCFAVNTKIKRMAFTDSEKIVITNLEGHYLSTWPERNVNKPHADFLWGITYSPDGSLLVSVGEDGKIVIWDVKVGIPIHQFVGHENWIWEVMFTDDGQYLVTFDDYCIKVWHVETILAGNFVNALYRKFIPPQKLKATIVIKGQHQLQIVSAEDYVESIVWDFNLHQVIENYKVYEGSEIPSHIFAMSDDGLYVAFVTGDNELYLWSKSDNSSAIVLKEMIDEITDIHILHREEEYLIITGNSNGTIETWNIKDEQLISRYQPPKIYQNMNICNVRGITTAEKQSLKNLGAIDTQ